MYFMASRYGKDMHLYCARGTNRLESYHRLLRKMFSSYNVSPVYACLLLGEFNRRYLLKCCSVLILQRFNQKRAIQYGMAEDLGHVEFELIEAISELESRLFDEPDRQYWGKSALSSVMCLQRVDFPRVGDFAESKESYVLLPVKLC